MPNDITQLLQQAYANYQSGLYEQSEKLCHQILEQQPNHPMALLMLGMNNIAQNQIDKAKINLSSASKFAPEDSHYLRQLISGLTRVDLHEDAARCWEILDRLEPGNEQILTNLGAALCMNNNLQKAVEAFEKAIAIKQDCAEAHLNLGITYNKLGYIELAETSYKKLLDLAPRHEMASSQLGGLLQLEGRLDEAIEVYKDALIDKANSADILFGLFGATFESAGTEKAIDMLEKATTDKPGHFLARSNLGIMLDHYGRHEDAEQHFDYVRTHTPQYAFNIDSWYYAREKISSDTRLFTLSNSGLAHAIDNVKIDGLFLEFGVWQGRSINFISSCTDQTVHGFDSFEGIPEEWEGEPSGSYSTFGKLPDVNANVVLHRGWFDNSLPEFLETNQEPVAFMNIDCDTYNSTKTIFDLLSKHIEAGTVIVFDEYFCFPNWRDHEYKAFQEFLLESGHRYEYLFFNLYTRQAGVLITS